MRSEKQRAAFEALRPQTFFHDLEYIEEIERVGELMQHPRLGIEMLYSESFYGPEDGRLYRCGRVVRTRKGCGLAVGSNWCCAADKLLVAAK